MVDRDLTLELAERGDALHKCVLEISKKFRHPDFCICPACTAIRNWIEIRQVVRSQEEESTEGDK